MSLAVLIFAVGFWWLQNQYFGWNVKPESDAEVLADGLTLILFALAFVGGNK